MRAQPGSREYTTEAQDEHLTCRGPFPSSPAGSAGALGQFGDKRGRCQDPNCNYAKSFKKQVELDVVRHDKWRAIIAPEHCVRLRIANTGICGGVELQR